MAFIVNNTRIEFDDYPSLMKYQALLDYAGDLITLLEAWYDPDVAELEFMTSGSTGEARIIRHSKSAIRRSAELTQKYFNYSAGDLTVLCLPVNFVAGKMMLLRAVIARLDIVLQPIQSVVMNAIKDRIGFLAITPHQLYQTYQEDSQSFRNVSMLLLGGSGLSQKHEEVIEALQLPVYIGYGMTESLTHVAMRKVNGPDRTDIYTSIDDSIRFRQSGDSCLIVEAEHLGVSLHTNDMVDLLSDSAFKWIGRRDNVINSGGIKILAEDYEKELSSVLDGSFFAFAQSNEIYGEIPVLLIEGSKHNFDLEAYKKSVYKLDVKIKPKALYFVDSIVLTKTGKIDRKGSLLNLNEQQKIEL